jgi:hypothetical protein
MLDAPLAYREALIRVAGRDPSFTHVAGWLIALTFKDIAGLSEQTRQSLQQEGAAFFYGKRYQPPLPSTATTDVRHKLAIALTERDHPEWRGHFLNPLPSASDLAQFQNWLRGLWDGLKTGEEGWIVTSGWMGRLSVKKNGALDGVSSPQTTSWLQRFQLKTYEALMAPEVRKHFRFCKSNVCRRPFLSIKRQAFCSVSCSQRHRTTLYRAKNRELFRQKRREYYLKKQREQSGNPNLRVQRRKGA